MTKQAKIYLVFTFLISWSLWWMLSYLLIKNFIQFGQASFWILFISGGNGPLVAALLSKKYFGEKQEIKDFIKQIFKFNISVFWYLGIALVLSIVGLVIWITNSLSQGFTESLLAQPIYMLVVLLPMMAIGGGLEEVGWRGVLLPELTKKLPITKSTIVVGVFWALWHLPLWFVEGLYFENISFFAYGISLVAVSFFYTVVYFGTKSIFMCIFLHSLYNSFFEILNPIKVNEMVGSMIDLVIYLSIFIVFYKCKRQIMTSSR